MNRTNDNELPVAHTAFATREWFEAWIEAFGGALWHPAADGDHCAIPYRLRRMAVGPLRVAAAESASNDHTPRYDILGEMENPAAVFARMMSQLEVSLLSFGFLSEQSRLLKIFRAAPAGLSYQIDFCEDSPYVNCDLSWDDYWERLGSTRSLWARRERKLLSQEGVAFRCLADWSEVEPILSTLYDVEASGWKGREGTAIKQDPRTRKFYDTCVRQWARSGLLRVFTLSLKDDILAFQINVLYRGVLTQLKVGYEERYSKLSPGQVMQLQLLRWAFANPEVRLYDLLGGGGKAEETKRKWATDVEPLYTVRIYRRNLPGMLAWLRHVVAPKLKRRFTGKSGKQHRPLDRHGADTSGGGDRDSD